MKFTSALAVAGLVLAGGTGMARAAAAAPEVFDDGAAIVYRGRIQPDGVARFVALLERAPKPVVITSAGGDEFASLDMAEAVLRLDVPVTVERYCLSGCANAVLVAARTRVIKGGAVIGLHGSAVSSLRAYEQTGRTPQPGIRENVARYEAIYRRRGADTGLLECAAERIEMLPELREQIDPATGVKEEGWPSRYSLWIPRDQDLHRFGVDVLRDTPLAATSKGRARLLQDLGFRKDARIRWGLGWRDCNGR